MSYVSYIIKEVSRNEFISGQDLSKLLQQEFSITPANARKVIQRAADKVVIKSSKPVTFGKGQYIYFTGEMNQELVLKAAENYRPSLFRVLCTLIENDGIISFYEALKIASSPLDENLTKMDNLNNIIGDLLAFNLICEVETYNGIKYIISSKYSSDINKEIIAEKHRTKMIIDCIFINDIMMWLKKHNLVNGKFIYRNKSTPSLGAKHNNFVWDAFAYTKTTGINTINSKNYGIDEKSTLVVIDMVVNRSYSKEDLDGFYNRVQGVINSTKSGIRKVFPIVVYNEIKSETLKKLNDLGFMTLDLGTVFGVKIRNIIEDLKFVKKGMISDEKIDSEEYLNRVESVLTTVETSGQGENLENIKGDLFEALMYPLLTKLFPSSKIRQGKVYIDKPINEGDTKEGYEYDYIVTDNNNDENVVIELKGYKSSSEIKLGDRDKKNTVRWFFRRTLPFAKKHLEKESNMCKVKGCYITTAKFANDALPVLEKINQGDMRPTKLEVYYDGNKLTEILDQNKLQHTSKIIKKYYSGDNLVKE